MIWVLQLKYDITNNKYKYNQHNTKRHKNSSQTVASVHMSQELRLWYSIGKPLCDWLLGPLTKLTSSQQHMSIEWFIDQTILTSPILGTNTTVRTCLS